MKIRVLLPFLFILVLSLGCNRIYNGEGPVVADTREVGEFNRIVLNMGATVLVKDSLVHSCVVKAQGNIQEAIITRMDGNTLVITTKGQLITDEDIVIEISMNKEMAFEVNGSGKIVSVNTFKNDELDFEINGSGVIEDDVRPLVVAAGGYTVAPVVRIAQFIGVAFRRASIAGPFRDHAGGMGTDA